MNPFRVTSLDDPALDDYRNVRDADLLGRRGVFMAEGRLVVRTLLSASPMSCRSVLVTPPALDSLRDVLTPGAPGAPPVYLADQQLLNRVAGFDIHRGCLAVGVRPPETPLAEFLARLPPGPSCVVVLENLTNHDNVGGIFRSALALGAAGVTLSPACCDPLYRKAIRVSMGAALRLPFARAINWPGELDLFRRHGFEVIALATGREAVDLESFAVSGSRPARVALLVGTEGDGLSPAAAALSDAGVRIAMSPGVDSLNAVVAASIALHRLVTPGRPSSRT